LPLAIPPAQGGGGACPQGPAGPQGSSTGGVEVVVVGVSNVTVEDEPSAGAINPTMPKKRIITAKNFILVTLYRQ